LKIENFWAGASILKMMEINVEFSIFDLAIDSKLKYYTVHNGSKIIAHRPNEKANPILLFRIDVV